MTRIRRVSCSAVLPPLWRTLEVNGEAGRKGACGEEEVKEEEDVVVVVVVGLWD